MTATYTDVTHTDVLMPPRLLAPGGAPADFGTHEQRYGPVSYGGPAQLLAAVAESGLTGRGGAAFATYRKLGSVADAGRRTGRAPVVVANGAEGEPASRKDRTLLHLSPHLVLDGLQLAAEAVGAQEAYLAVEAGASYLEAAIAERRRDPLSVKVIRVPKRFLSGQSSALTSYVSGGAALPQQQRPPVRERGVHRAPTLVQNVETLAHLALIARYGADWFRAAGTPSEPGSALCTVHVPGRAASSRGLRDERLPPRAPGPAAEKQVGRDGRRGHHEADMSEVRVVEAPFGMPIGRLLPLGSTGAVLIGGYHGTWIPAAEAARLPLSAAYLGAGVLAVLPADHCGLAETARVLRYLALESAGQCGPCLNGLPRIAAAFQTLAAPGPQGTIRTDVARWAGLVEGRGACHHPDGTVRLVRSALTTFATELDAHGAGFCTATDQTPLLPVPNDRI